MRACVCRFSKGNELRREADSFEPYSTRKEFDSTRITELLLGKAAAFECRVPGVALTYVTSATVELVLLVAVIAIQD